MDSFFWGIAAAYREFAERLDAQPSTAYGGVVAVLNDMRLDLRPGKEVNEVSDTQLRKWAHQARHVLKGECARQLGKLTQEAAEWVVEGAWRRGLIASQTRAERKQATVKANTEKRMARLKERIEKTQAKAEARAKRLAEAIASGKKIKTQYNHKRKSRAGQVLKPDGHVMRKRRKEEEERSKSKNEKGTN